MEEWRKLFIIKMTMQSKSELARVNIIVGDNALIVIYLTATVLHEQEFVLSLPYRL